MQSDGPQPPTGLPIISIDGANFDDFEGFVREFNTHLSDYTWTGNLDAFNDILRGGFGTPDGGFVFEWLHSDESRSALGWSATIRWLKESLRVCHPTNRLSVRKRLMLARIHRGSTLFDWLVEIIRVHGPIGLEADNNVLLRLR